MPNLSPQIHWAQECEDPALSRPFHETPREVGPPAAATRCQAPLAERKKKRFWGVVASSTQEIGGQRWLAFPVTEATVLNA